MSSQRIMARRFGPFGLVFSPDANLYVVSLFPNSVHRYDGLMGTFIDDFVASSMGGLDLPQGLRFGSDGSL